MSNKIRGNAGLMMALMAGAMSRGQSSMIFTGRGEDAFLVSDGKLIPLKTKVPNGCKEYFFEGSGEFSTENKSVLNALQSMKKMKKENL